MIKWYVVCYELNVDSLHRHYGRVFVDEFDYLGDAIEEYKRKQTLDETKRCWVENKDRVHLTKVWDRTLNDLPKA